MISFPEQDISNTLKIHDIETHNTNNDLEKNEIDLEKKNMAGHQQSYVKKKESNFKATEIDTESVSYAPGNNLLEPLEKGKIIIDENTPDPGT